MASVSIATPVGAELARDSGGSGCIEVECVAVIASKPAPTMTPNRSQIRTPDKIPLVATPRHALK
ncbi:hypothetical protein CVG87_24845 [Pseudomonas sp. WCS365]|nr:hypothetical protein CVG87_24845 [Pseudomonas sp. WCS365]